MKREKTAEPNIYIGHNGMRYYRKGDFERSLETTSQREAVKRKKALEQRRDTFGKLAYEKSVNDVAQEFLDERWREVGASTIRLSTYQETEDMFRVHLLDFFGSKRFAVIDEPLWDEFVAKNSGMDLSNARKIFGYFLSWAKRKQYYRYTPDLKIPLVTRRQRKILSPDVCRRILSNSHGSLLLFVAMYLFMGMRRSEIIKLTWMRVRFDANFLVLFAEDTKTNRMRQIPLNPFVRELLTARLAFQGTRLERPVYVFPNAKDPKRHASLSGLKTAWQTCLVRSELKGADIQWHDLRATHQYYAHKRIDFTDTQREKFSGSSIDVQKRHYVSFEAEDLKGLETVVQFKGLDEVLAAALSDAGHGKNTGKLAKRKIGPARKDLK